MLPFHVEWLTNLHRLFVLLDIIIIVMLWPRMSLTLRHVLKAIPLCIVYILTLLLSLTASFPGERVYNWFHNPMTQTPVRRLHSILKAGWTTSFFSNRVILVDRQESLSLRNRDIFAVRSLMARISAGWISLGRTCFKRHSGEPF